MQNRIYVDSSPEQSYIIEFNGEFTHEAAKKLATQWRSDFSLKANTTSTTVIFDATHMKNYEPMARAEWQKVMKDLKSKINEIWVVSDSQIILAGAKLLGIFTSFKIKTAANINILRDKIAA